MFVNVFLCSEHETAHDKSRRLLFSCPIASLSITFQWMAAERSRWTTRWSSCTTARSGMIIPFLNGFNCSFYGGGCSVIVCELSELLRIREYSSRHLSSSIVSRATRSAGNSLYPSLIVSC